MIRKRGLSHIEAILSFVIFTGFLIFAFLFFSPFSEGNRLLDSSIDYSFREISDKVNVVLESYSVVLSDTTGIEPPFIIHINHGAGLEAQSSVEDESGNLIDSKLDEEGVHFNPGVRKFVVIRLSEEFIDDSVDTGNGLTEGTNYRISSSERKKIASKKKFLDLNQSYYNDYENLKVEFNLPNRVDFGFALAIGDDIISADRPIPESLEVISKQERFEVIEEDGEINFANLVVWVW